MNSHSKRHSIRNLAMDLTSVFHEHKEGLVQIDEAYKKGDFVVPFKKTYRPYQDLVEYRKSSKYSDLQVCTLAQQLYNGIYPILFTYGVRMSDVFWSSELETKSMTFDDSLSLHQIIVALMQTFVQNDAMIIEHHLIHGHYLKAYHRLLEVMENPTHLSNEMLFNVYQKSLNQVMSQCEKPEELKNQFKRLQTLVSKERASKPLPDEVDPIKLVCPYCHKELFIGGQHYCHHCGQRLEIPKQLGKMKIKVNEIQSKLIKQSQIKNVK